MMMKSMTSLIEKQFKVAVTELQNGLRIKKEYWLDKDQYNIYFKYLKDLTHEQLMKAVKVIIQTEDIAYFPTVARIRTAAGIDVAPPPKDLSMEDINNLWSERIDDDGKRS